MKEKVVLAYSGGLDTTALIPWLKETFDYDVVCCCVNCGQGNELDGLDERAKLSGASKLYIEDIVDEFCDDFIVPCVQAGAVYEHKYLLGTSMARPAIAKKLVEIARKEGAVAICHGATGKGNDQIRFELGIKALAPDIKIIAPWRMTDKWTMQSREDEIDYCKAHGIDGLVVIGGDGSFQGAKKLAALGINTIGVPGTIDLDIACTEYTIGFDTAVNTAMEAIDKIRDTSTSHERCSIIEVMGRDAGYLALWCGIANGAEKILMPEEKDYDEQALIEDILANKKRGKKNYIIINAEGVGDSINMAKRIEEATGIETRATILGHMQRGGSPTCKDRVYASTMGAIAVDLLCKGKTNRVVGYKNGQFIDFDIEEALAMKKTIPAYQYDVAKTLAL